MAKKLRKLAVARFREWLEAQPDHERYTVRNSRECPIAAFVDADHRVYTDYIALHALSMYDELLKGDPRRVELPVWARRFVSKVDALSGSISRDEALAILKEVTAKEPRA
jgi:hypothetical protein